MRNNKNSLETTPSGGFLERPAGVLLKNLPVGRRRSRPTGTTLFHALTLLLVAQMLLCAPISLLAQQAAPVLPPTQAQSDSLAAKALADLRTDLNNLFGDSTIANAHVGIHVASLKTKEVLFARNDTKSFVPASNMKIVSTAAAMDFLGADFKYTTTVFLDGLLKKSSGEFVGNVIIRGAGDPSLSQYFYPDPMSILHQWCDTFDSLGIHSIRGNIVGDDSYFDDEPWGMGWSWDDIPYSFSSQLSALSFNDNKVDVVVKPAFSLGQTAEAMIIPTTNYVSLVNTVKTLTKDSANGINATRQAYSNVIQLSGSIAQGSDSTQDPRRTSTVAIDNPTLFLVSLFKRTLIERGIIVRGGIYDAKQWGDKVAYTELRPVCYTSSPPLKDIIRNINTVSNNLAAELVWRTAAKEFSGKGNAEQGAVLVQKFCEKHGISTKGLVVADGSGLSRFNIVSPKHLVGILTAMYNSRNKVAFTRSLGAPGEKGTLQNRLKNTIAEKALRAKTGTLTNISALSGYISSREQEPLVFSMIFNSYTVPPSLVRNIQDLVCMRLAGFSRR
jgi:D-alanyl-D-alanine carboxypeptidase/D-alanyl-D-alanine-endopeptidase (penicillin-binding protein 4)